MQDNKDICTMAHIKRADTRTKKQQQDEVLALYEESANITLACKKASIPRRTFYNWCKEEVFNKRYAESSVLAVGLLEDEAKRRAVNGVIKPVYYKGAVCGKIKEYSDVLLIVLLKAHAPEKYKERVQAEHSGPNGKPIETNTTVIVKTTLKLS